MSNLRKIYLLLPRQGATVRFAFSGNNRIASIGRASMSVTKTTKCPRCFGVGHDAAGKTCSTCNGAGEVSRQPLKSPDGKSSARRDTLPGAFPPVQQN